MYSSCSREDRERFFGCCVEVRHRGTAARRNMQEVIDFLRKYGNLAEEFAFDTCSDATMPVPDSLLKVNPLRAAAWILAFPTLTKQPGIVEYYDSLADMKRGKRTPIKYGKFLVKVLHTEDWETTALVEQLRVEQGVREVKFIENDDLKGWFSVYNSDHVVSCMSDNEAVSCYAAAGFGLPDNGLRLAYIGDSPKEAVSRCIVHEPSRTYVRVYGDSYLQRALSGLDYKPIKGELNGVRLPAIAAPSSEISEPGYYYVPHIDAPKTQYVQLDKATNTLVLSTSGISADTAGKKYTQLEFTCRCCGEALPVTEANPTVHCDHDKQELVWKRRVCKSCASSSVVYALYQGKLYSTLPEEIVEIAGEWYLNLPDAQEEVLVA